MKQRFFLTFLFAICVFTISNAQNQDVRKDKVNYWLEDGKAYILGFDKKATKVIIKSSIKYKKNTYPVVGLKVNNWNKPYYDGKDTSIRELIFEEGVTAVPDYIARNMERLEKVILSNTIITIGQEAFSRCKSLSQIIIPSSVKTIETFAFRGCTSLESVEFCEGLQEVGVGAFYGCKSLKKAILPRSVTSVEGSAFQGCYSLQKDATSINNNGQK